MTIFEIAFFFFPPRVNLNGPTNYIMPSLEHSGGEKRN